MAEDNASENDNDSAESQMCIQVVRKGKKLTSTIDTFSTTKQVKVEHQLDTGASCNVFDQKYYNVLGQPPLNTNKLSMLQLYDGTRTEPLGKCEVDIDGQFFKFFVVESNNLSLLSLDACLNLGVLSANKEWVNVVTDTQHTDINRRLQHADIFEGFGCLPGEYHIEVDETVSPRQCHNRKVALAMRKDLKEKLKCLTEHQVITKVDHLTPWISNVLARRKSNEKLPVCIDPTNLNKAIKRNDFPMPTLEDVLPELHGAKVFPLCDAKMVSYK